MVVWITWPDAELTLPLLSKLAHAGLQHEKSDGLFYCIVFKFGAGGCHKG